MTGNMTYFLFFILFVVLILGVIAGVIYNQIACQRNMLKEYFSKLDIHFQYRHNFLPLFFSTIQTHVRTEKELFDKLNTQIKECQSAYYVKEKVEAENILTNSLNVLFLILENYPSLKENETFLNLKNQIIQIEEKIQTAKKQYNSAVRMYNDSITIVPHKFFAKILGFKEANFFEIEALNVHNENIKK